MGLLPPSLPPSLPSSASSKKAPRSQQLRGPRQPYSWPPLAALFPRNVGQLPGCSELSTGKAAQRHDAAAAPRPGWVPTLPCTAQPLTSSRSPGRAAGGRAPALSGWAVVALVSTSTAQSTAAPCLLHARWTPRG